MIVVGPPDPAIATLRLRDRVRFAAAVSWSWCSTPDPYPTPYRAVGRDRKGRSTVPRVSAGGTRARPVPYPPVPLSALHDAGRDGSLLQIGCSLLVRPAAWRGGACMIGWAGSGFLPLVGRKESTSLGRTRRSPSVWVRLVDTAISSPDGAAWSSNPPSLGICDIYTR